MKTKPGAVLSVVAVAAAGAVSGTGGPASAADAVGQAAAAAAPTGPGGTWGPGQPIPDMSALRATDADAGIKAVTCTTPGNCTAVGYYVSTASGSLRPLIVTETADTWGDAQQVGGVSGSLTHVSRGAAGYCTAAGYFVGTDGKDHGFLDTESAGVWGKATAINDAGLGTLLVTLGTALSCPAAGNCTAVGSYVRDTSTSSLLTFTMDESGGTWGEPQSVPGLASLQPASVHQLRPLRAHQRAHQDQAAVAEELGQLPARGLTVTGQVRHIYEGVSIKDLGKDEPDNEH